MKENCSEKQRCKWCNLANPLYVRYHDQEWGVPSHDDRALFELLILEFFQFDPERVRNYDETKKTVLMEDKSIIRNRRKIDAAVINAEVFLKIQREWGTFADYIWHFTDGKVIYENDRTSSPLSDQIAKDLKKRGMKFIGTTIVYSYLQAAGILNSHEEGCFLYQSGKS